ncbi:MAG: FeoB-associated Cys-rich membrane protein [Spirochaetales bacterium]|nr:FeoB-associated Cys-rich membrane protein [Spirochaetales bacterium]
MSIMDIAVVGVILLVISLAVWKIVRDKKRGVKCSGCPDSGKCDCH